MSLHSSLLFTLCGLILFLLIPTSVLSSGLIGHYRCGLCQSYMSFVTQRWTSAMAKSASSDSLDKSEISKYALPTAQDFCTSEAAKRLRLVHIYMDEVDAEELKQLRARETALLQLDENIRVAEHQATQMKNQAEHQTNSSDTHEHEHEHTAEDNEFEEEFQRSASSPASMNSPSHLEFGIHHQRSVFSSLPNTIPKAHIDHYYGKSRVPCLVYQDGRCQLYDTAPQLVEDVRELIPNPFTLAYVRDISKKREIDVQYIESRRKFLMGTSRHTQGGDLSSLQQKIDKLDAAKKQEMEERINKWCKSLVEDLNSNPTVTDLVTTGCTWSDRQKPNSLGTPVPHYSSLCPTVASCHCLRDTLEAHPFCDTTDPYSLIQPQQLKCHSTGRDEKLLAPISGTSGSSTSRTSGGSNIRGGDGSPQSGSSSLADQRKEDMRKANTPPGDFLPGGAEKGAEAAKGAAPEGKPKPARSPDPTGEADPKVVAARAKHVDFSEGFWDAGYKPSFP